MLCPEAQARHVHRQPSMAKIPLQPSTAVSGLLALDPERRNLQKQPQLLQLQVLAMLRGMDISLVPCGNSATRAIHTSRDLWALFQLCMDLCVWQEADEPNLLGWLNLQPYTASLCQFRTAGVSKSNTDPSGYMLIAYRKYTP